MEANATTRPNVKVIPASISVGETQARQHPRTIRHKVAGYARVSTAREEQTGSFDTQVAYYEALISGNPAWHYAGVYADHGASGILAAKRKGFSQMIADALAGNIDLILTKSVSRFARNTLETLQTLRALKERGVEVRFENESLSSLDPSCELLLTILASISQEESRNISENVRWSMRAYFEGGNVLMSYGHFLGYEKGQDGKPRVVEAEAEVVRRIYALFLEGASCFGIAKTLTQAGILSPGGKRHWNANTVRSILTNEKYTGNARLQKYYVPDFLLKKLQPNRGERAQYYVENSHPAIVSQALFDRVQDEMARRSGNGVPGNWRNPLTQMIFCGCCGGKYGPRHRAAGNPGPSPTPPDQRLWQCLGTQTVMDRNGARRRRKPDGVVVSQQDIQDGFLAAFNTLCPDRAIPTFDGTLWKAETLRATVYLPDASPAGIVVNREAPANGAVRRAFIQYHFAGGVTAVWTVWTT